MSLYEDKLYNKHSKILEKEEKGNRVNHTRDVRVEGLSRYKKKGDSKFQVDISFRTIDFVENKQTKKVMKGSKVRRRFKQR